MQEFLSGFLPVLLLFAFCGLIIWIIFRFVQHLNMPSECDQRLRELSLWLADIDRLYNHVPAVDGLDSAHCQEQLKMAKECYQEALAYARDRQFSKAVASANVGLACAHTFQSLYRRAFPNPPARP